MSTPATFQITEGPVSFKFYIHHDGNPDRVRAILYNACRHTIMLDRESTGVFTELRSRFIGAFIRSYDLIEIIDQSDDPDNHGDACFSYLIEREDNGIYTIRVMRRGTRWRLVFAGPLVVWMNQDTESLREWLSIDDLSYEGRIVQVEEPIMRRCFLPTTNDYALRIAIALSGKSKEFSVDNPNRKGFKERAERWANAIGERGE